jgi:Protein of unknown function (DUF3311)
MANRPPARRPGWSGLWYVLLLAPFVGTLFPGWYARSEPALGGWPFFYWYQFLWVIITAALTAVVYVVTTQRRQRRRGGE